MGAGPSEQSIRLQHWKDAPPPKLFFSFRNFVFLNFFFSLPFLFCIVAFFVSLSASLILRHSRNHTLSSTHCTLIPSLSPSPPHLLLWLVRWECVFEGGWGEGGLMSAQAMIRSEELICCGSAPQRLISIPPLTPQLPHTVQRHNRLSFPSLLPFFFLVFFKTVLPSCPNNERYKYHCYALSQLSWSTPFDWAKRLSGMK